MGKELIDLLERVDGLLRLTAAEFATAAAGKQYVAACHVAAAGRSLKRVDRYLRRAAEAAGVPLPGGLKRSPVRKRKGPDVRKVIVFFSLQGRPLHLVSPIPRKSKAGPEYQGQCGRSLRLGWIPHPRHSCDLGKLAQLDCPDCESIRVDLTR